MGIQGLDPEMLIVTAGLLLFQKFEQRQAGLWFYKQDCKLEGAVGRYTNVQVDGIKGFAK